MSETCRCIRSKPASEGPLLAFAEEGSEAEVLFDCGDGGCGVEQAAELPPIGAIRVERVRKNADGTYEMQEDRHISLDSTIKTRGCLPWVKISRDASRYTACLTAARRMGQIDNSKKLYELLKDKMMEEDQEVFYVILFDTQLFIRGISELARGARDRVMAPIPDVLRLPIVDGAMAFAVAHNHPSGKAKPSDSDKELTKAIQKAANAIEILFIDHIVVGANSYYSFREQGLL